VGVEYVRDPETLLPLPPGILAAVFIPATTEDDVEVIASDDAFSSTILVPALLRALQAPSAS